MVTPSSPNLADEAKALWLALARPIASSILAGDVAVSYHAAGDIPRALCQARIAIGESSLAMATAIEMRERTPLWVPVADAIIAACTIHVAFLEDEVDALRRRAKLRTGMPTRAERKAFTKLGEHWSIAMLVARDIVSSVGGDPDSLETFDALKNAMAASLSSSSLLRWN